MKQNSIIFDFELEFCLKKDSYMKAYNEDGSLWGKLHKTHMEYFHTLFETDEGQQAIIEDIKSINLIFFKRRKTFLNGFDKNEFSNEEYGFLKYFIMES